MSSTLFAGALVALALSMGASAALAAEGATIFADVCAACHGPEGVGTPGVAPPLQDPPLWAGLGEKAPGFVAGVVISGLSGTIMSQGVGYYGLVMPPQSDYSDEDLEAVASYVLKDLAKVEGVVTPEMVAERRAAPLSHKELMAIRGGGM